MIIGNAKVVTWGETNQILENHAVRIQLGKIVEIAPTDQLKVQYPQEEWMDAQGQYLMPGNICAHTHFYSAYSRGMAIPGSAPKDFTEILQKLWWSLDKALDEEAVRYSALVSLIDAIRHGTTTLIDHHASPNAINGSLDIIGEAVLQSGLRASLCYEVTDRDGIKKAEQGIEENLRFIERIQRNGSENQHLSALFGLHASLTLSNDTLEIIGKKAPAGVGFHIHVAEDLSDEYDSLEKSETRIVDRLERYGILGPKSIAVHAIHVDAREIGILAKTGTWVTHQPRSNMNNAVGVAQVEAMLRAGIRVGLGNDGFSNAMWEEWKAVYFVHKLWNHDPRRMSAATVAEMAIKNNAALVARLFDGLRVGCIEPGAAADLILVDYHPFTPLTPGNLPWHIVFGFNESMITTTMVDGKLLMKDRKLLLLDEEAIFNEALALAPRVWEKYNLICTQ